MNIRSLKIKYTCVGMFSCFFIVICLCVFAYSILPSWKKAYVIHRISLFTTKEIRETKFYEDLLYSLPDKWGKNMQKSIYDPRKYLTSRNYSFLQDEKVIYRFQDYYEALKIENVLVSTSKEAYHKKQTFIDTTSIQEFKKIIKYSVGFTPIRKSEYKSYKLNILDRNNLKIPFLRLEGSKKNVIIAIHGRMSSPEAVNGIVNDYSNSFGKLWNESGYTVYSLAVNNISNEAYQFPRLGLSAVGADLSKIEDLIKYIIHNYGDSAHISIAGISYGSLLANLSGILFDELDSVISIGGSGTREYLSAANSSALKNEHSSTYRNSYLLDQIIYSADIYRIINKTKKLVFVSIGIGDAGSFGHHGQQKFDAMKSITKLMDYPEKFSYEFFNGGHETNPKGEILGLKLLREQNK